MKLSHVAKGTRAVKAVRFKPAIAPQPGSATSGGSVDHLLVGVRVLTGAEQAQIYESAAADAREKGVAEWNPDHPICQLYEKAHAIALAYVDVDQATGKPCDSSKLEPFFDGGVRDVLESELVGTDNIVYLYDQFIDWQDECSILAKHLKPDEVISILLAEAARPDNDDSPLDRMRPVLQRAFLRTTAVLYATLLTGKSDSISPEGSSGLTSVSKPPRIEKPEEDEP